MNAYRLANWLPVYKSTRIWFGSSIADIDDDIIDYDNIDGDDDESAWD